MDDRNNAVLQRIAQTLGVPVDLLGVASCGQAAQAPATAVAEELELLRLFQAVGDPSLRRACLDFVRNATLSNDLAAG